MKGIALSDWTPDTLDKIVAADDLKVAPFRDDDVRSRLCGTHDFASNRRFHEVAEPHIDGFIDHAVAHARHTLLKEQAHGLISAPAKVSSLK